MLLSGVLGYEFFSRKTGRDRKLKYVGVDDPYYMFLKIGHSFVDISYDFWMIMDDAPTSVKNSPITASIKWLDLEK